MILRLTSFYQCKDILLSGIVQCFHFSHGDRERHSETTEVGLEACSDGTSFQNTDRKCQIAIGNLLQRVYGGLRGIFLCWSGLNPL